MWAAGTESECPFERKAICPVRHHWVYRLAIVKQIVPAQLAHPLGHFAGWPLKTSPKLCSSVQDLFASKSI